MPRPKNYPDTLEALRSGLDGGDIVKVRIGKTGSVSLRITETVVAGEKWIGTTSLIWGSLRPDAHIITYKDIIAVTHTIPRSAGDHDE